MTPPVSPSPSARRFFLLLLAAVVVAVLLLVRPLAAALFLAMALAGAIWPVHQRLAKKVRVPALSAGLLVAGVVVLIVGPLVLFSAFLLKEGAEAARFISETVRGEGVLGLVERLPAPLDRMAHGALARMPTSTEGGVDAALQSHLSGQGGRAASAVAAALVATGSFAFQTVMMLIALYFLLLQGDELVEWVDSALPLHPGQTRELLDEFKKVSFAVMTATAITAAVQAFAALVGYVIARVPHPVFFAAVTFFVAFIPAVGAASVSLAAAALLLFQGHPYMAIFLALWGALVVGIVDNLVKPHLIKAGMQIRGAIVFFSLIAGLKAFGPVGLLLGPLLVTAFLALVRIYQRDFKPPATDRALPPRI